MANPWEEISLSDYENHMKLDSVMQLQSMNQMMKGQFSAHPADSVMILGIAGGNGLEHIERNRFQKVYGIDINSEYLAAVKERYPDLNGILKCIRLNLMDETDRLPKADLLIANLLIEYIGYDCFQKAVKQVQPDYVSCIIQINVDDGWVSDSPYLHAFDDLDRVHHQMEEASLIRAMKEIGYRLTEQTENPLPNGKKLVQLDFEHQKRDHEKEKPGFRKEKYAMKNKEQKSFKEIAEILKKFDIGGITGQLIHELETSYHTIPIEIKLNKTAMLLSALGSGTYDHSKGTWQPGTNGVYSFDVEVYDLDHMYTHFLSGVSALDKEELDFKNIQEDTSGIDWEEGTGTRTVTFEWNAKTFCIEAAGMNDWFDMNAANALNQILIENGNGRRLFFTDDGYQECIIFYRDADWADSFQKETGLVLS